MAKISQTKIILSIVLGMPLVLVAFLYLFSNTVYHSVPYVYETQANGDSVIRSLPEQLTLYDLDGNEWTSENMKGKMLLINFFSARDDSGSKRTVLHGNLKRIYDNVQWENKPNLRFLSISTGDSLPDLKEYEPQMEDVDSQFWPIVYADRTAIYELMADALGNKRMMREGRDYEPFTDFYVALIDKEGKLRANYVGTNLQEERKLQETLVALWRLEYEDDIDASPLLTTDPE
ncbi:MAG: SCO family protein [Bacteroidia bacterium]